MGGFTTVACECKQCLYLFSVGISLGHFIVVKSGVAIREMVNKALI